VYNNFDIVVTLYFKFYEMSGKRGPEQTSFAAYSSDLCFEETFLSPEVFDL
jgi:hypothetical protein